MIEIVKTEIAISNNLYSKIKWCSNYCKVKPKIYNGCLRIIKHTNLAYIEPHRVIINNTLYLFFNDQEYFYISNLRTKYPLSKLLEFIKSQGRIISASGKIISSPTIKISKKANTFEKFFAFILQRKYLKDKKLILYLLKFVFI